MLQSRNRRQFLPIGLFLLLTVAAAHGSCVANPMMQGQDPQAEFKDGYYNLVQSDGCKIHL
jgi:hypothetical protein